MSGEAVGRAPKDRTVIDASCDAEGVDDVASSSTTETIVLIDTELDEALTALAEQLERSPSPWPRLLVALGGDELWPYPLQLGGGRPALGQTVSWLLRSLAKLR